MPGRTVDDCERFPARGRRYRQLNDSLSFLKRPPKNRGSGYGERGGICSNYPAMDGLWLVADTKDTNYPPPGRFCQSTTR